MTFQTCFQTSGCEADRRYRLRCQTDRHQYIYIYIYICISIYINKAIYIYIYTQSCTYIYIYINLVADAPPGAGTALGPRGSEAVSNRYRSTEPCQCRKDRTEAHPVIHNRLQGAHFPLVVGELSFLTACLNEGKTSFPLPLTGPYHRLPERRQN